MNLINHYEIHLGQIQRGWSLTSEGKNLRVLQFGSCPWTGVNTFATIGLSNESMPMSNGRLIRHELVFSAHANFDAERVASFILTFGRYVLDQFRSLMRGDLVGPSAPIIPGASTTAVYATMPFPFDEEFAVCRMEEEAVVMVYIVGITASECEFIRRHGWEAFEDKLEGSDVDLFDLRRDSIV